MLTRDNDRMTMPERTNERTNERRTIVIGQMDNTLDHTYESANRIYGSYGCCPTIPTSCGGGHTPKVIKQWKK